MVWLKIIHPFFVYKVYNFVVELVYDTNSSEYSTYTNMTNLFRIFLFDHVHCCRHHFCPGIAHTNPWELHRFTSCDRGGLVNKYIQRPVGTFQPESHLDNPNHSWEVVFTTPILTPFLNVHRNYGTDRAPYISPKLVYMLWSCICINC